MILCNSFVYYLNFRPFSIHSTKNATYLKKRNEDSVVTMVDPIIQHVTHSITQYLNELIKYSTSESEDGQGLPSFFLLVSNLPSLLSHSSHSSFITLFFLFFQSNLPITFGSSNKWTIDWNAKLDNMGKDRRKTPRGRVEEKVMDPSSCSFVTFWK